MNRFSTATSLNATKSSASSSSSSSDNQYKQALLNVLKESNNSRSSEESQLLEFENFIYHQQQFQNEPPPPPPKISESSMRSKEYTDAPGELDMLIGFFIMNAACIVFFLLFGMCVICSCMRRKPNFMNKSSEKEPTPPKRRLLSPTSVSPKPPIPIVNPTLKPTFKAMISKAMKNDDFRKMNSSPQKLQQQQQQQLQNCDQQQQQRRCSVTSPIMNETTHLLRRASEKPLMNETHIEIDSPGARCHSVTRQVQIQIEPTDIPFEKELTAIEISPPPFQQQQQQLCPKCHPSHSPEDPDHICDCNCENQAPQESQPEHGEDEEEHEEEGASSSSLIRQNLLGPLSFDDLYYT